MRWQPTIKFLHYRKEEIRETQSRRRLSNIKTHTSHAHLQRLENKYNVLKKYY